MTASPSTKVSPQAHCWQFNNKHVHTSCVDPEGVYTRAGLIQAACIFKNLKQIKIDNPNQEETIDIDNHDLLKA